MTLFRSALIAVSGWSGAKQIVLSMSWAFQWTGWTNKRMTMGRYQYFSDSELQGLDDGLCQMLSIARGKANVPFIITCGLRTLAQNAALAESVSDSAHLTGHAVDLSCPDSSTRFAMLSGLLAAGFTRIGIYSAHIHVDNDATKPPNVAWYVVGA